MTVARGGKRGKTAGRGTKGQKARAGHKIRPEMRDVIKRLPKMRGRGKNSNLSIQTKAVAVNLSTIDKVFASGDTVTPATLVEKGVVGMWKGAFPQVKVLSVGEISKKLTVDGCEISAAAKEKIEKAGGSVK